MSEGEWRRQMCLGRRYIDGTKLLNAHAPIILKKLTGASHMNDAHTSGATCTNCQRVRLCLSFFVR